MKGRASLIEKDKFTRIRTAKNLILGLLIVAVLLFSSYIVFRAGYSTNPLYIPLDRALTILLLTGVLISVLNIAFRSLEIKHAPREGQRFLLTDSSWKGAKKAFVAALLAALFFGVPVAQALVINIMSPSASRTLGAGESYPLSFANQDPLGITKARELRVAVQSGSLRVRVDEGGRIVNPGGTNLTAGERQSFALSSASYIPYAVSFENTANVSTRFTYQVDFGFPSGFTSLITFLSIVVAVSNLGWMMYLRRIRRGLSQEPPYQGPAPQTPYPAPQMPSTRPWYELNTMWHPVYSPWRSTPIRAPPRGDMTGTVTAQELPPPPPQVEPYEVDIPPPPPDHTGEDDARALLREIGLDVSSLLDKAEERVSAGEYHEALEDFDTVLQSDQRNLRALLKKAELLRKLQRAGEALDCLQRALRVDPWHQKALLSKGSLLEEQGRDDEALECYETILQGGPEYLEALVRKGEMMIRLQEAELALEAFREALRLRPGDADLEARIRFLEESREDPLDRAGNEIEANRFERAEELLRVALEGPRGGEARRELTDLYFKMGRQEEALQLLDQSIEEDPGNLDLILMRVGALSHRGRLADALEACEKACEIAPEEATVWSIRGNLEADLGLESRARESLQKALELNPEDPDSRRRLEELYAREQESAELEQVLRKVEGIPEEGIRSILGAFHGLKQLKGAKVKALSSLEGISDEIAKRVLKRVRKGR